MNEPVVRLGNHTGQVVKVWRRACLMGTWIRFVDVLKCAQKELNMLVDLLTNFLQTIFRWLLLHHHLMLLLLLLDRIKTSWGCRPSTTVKGIKLLLWLWKAILHLLLLEVVVVHLLEGVVPAGVNHLSCLVYVH